MQDDRGGRRYGHERTGRRLLGQEEGLRLFGVLTDIARKELIRRTWSLVIFSDYSQRSYSLTAVTMPDSNTSAIVKISFPPPILVSEVRDADTGPSSARSIRKDRILPSVDTITKAHVSADDEMILLVRTFDMLRPCLSGTS